MAAAPDSASAIAGRRLAGPGPWSEVGQDGPVIWGRCRGSAREPYRVVVDTSAPRYQCTCPSRKFPCKHALALLFRWAERRFPADEGVRRVPAGPGTAATDAPDPGRVDQGDCAEADAVGVDAVGVDAAESDTDGAERDAKSAERAAAARVRAAERDERVAAGLLELDQWLIDRMADGLGRLAAQPMLLEDLAARMIDAQVPGVARALRRLSRVPTGADDWAVTMLGEFGMLGLLARAFLRRDDLDPALEATVRAHLGFTVGRAEVLRGVGVPDRWSVVGLHDTEDDERVSTRRVWLFGRETGRFAVVLLFSVNGAPYEMTVAPGMELDADVHFYPGRPPLRALIGNRRDERAATSGLACPGETVTGARDAWGVAVADDPWLTLWPGALRGRIGVRSDARGSAFALVDDEGAGLLLAGPEPLLWQAMAISGGAGATWFGELRPKGFNPLALVDPELTDGELVVL